MSFPIAALGGEIIIDTVDGKVAYEVKPGTQTDTKVRLKGKGVPTLRNKEIRGDHYITLVVQVPDKISNEAKEALKQYDEAMGGTLHATKDTGPESEPQAKDKKKKGFWKNSNHEGCPASRDIPFRV